MNHRWSDHALVISSGLLLSLVSWSLAEQSTVSTNLTARARALVVERFAPKVPGLVVAASQDGRIIWSEGFGMADLEGKRPVTPATLFRIGSVSKPLTAAGLMLLVEKHQIDLDSDVRKYVPTFPEKEKPITTRQLAGHLAGIRHYRGQEFLLNKPFTNVLEGLDIFKNDPLLFAPGERFLYSSYGFNLISAVMQSAASQDFLVYMDKAVFAPLAMKSTIADYAGRAMPLRTHFYARKEDGGFEVAPTVDNSYKWAGGGFLSTGEDLVRFGMAHLAPGFLKAESLAALFTSQKTNDGHETGYGIGWSLRKDEQGHQLMVHTGGSVGGSSILLLHPKSKVVLAMISNCTQTPFDKNSEALAELFAESLGP